MGKEDEINYLSKLDSAGLERNVNKLSQDDLCTRSLMDISQAYALLPSPPRKIIDIGCGAGWTSNMLALRGYEVVGVDISPDMIKAAQETNKNSGLTFSVKDYDDLGWDDEFDGAVFIDSLHHAQDENKVLSSAYRALKKHGSLVIIEPGMGHAAKVDTLNAVQNYGVTEKDMHPFKTVPILRELGFSEIRVFPRMSLFHEMVHSRKVLRKIRLLRYYLRKQISGIVVAIK
jgi:ubiquinone/menaquinone biosynthesis C-methylase UbiE